MKSALEREKLALKQFKEELSLRFLQNKNILSLTRLLVQFIDTLLLSLFKKYKLKDSGSLCLLALGSYGRRELQLHSDIDLLLLHKENISKKDLQRAQAFIQDCWDIGLIISHQLTTVKACADLAATDLSVISSILDARLLSGSQSLMEELCYQTHPLHIWPSYDYFVAKKKEQEQRYVKYGETAYNLEPNVKQGPGGLRDLQILLSISKRHYQIKKLAEGRNCNFITDKEYDEFLHCQHFLWRVRFALHILANKQEERLLFNYQKQLASVFGFKDKPHSLAIEQFMKVYFKVIKRSRELNEMLLQWFSDIIAHHEKQILCRLDKHFLLSNNFIEVSHPKVFVDNPCALILLFLWMAKRPSISGIRASTIRLIREHLYLMNKQLLDSPTVTQTFLAIFKEGLNPFFALHQMSRYGVLGHYLDCFAAVTGQMQYDLFHVYTVEQHTLFVIRNLVRFLQPNFASQFPLAATLMPTLSHPHILYLAALFHDIAKGRGGDHSELGAIEATLFAKRHLLSSYETDLFVWLVKNHLLMSHTAQRKDIYDPKTVQHFCRLLPDPSYLNYLYLLTVADICATNPVLWNSWRDSLLKELYRAAEQHYLLAQSNLEEPSIIEARKEQALALLQAKNIAAKTVKQLWQDFKDRYFLHESAEMIAYHSEAILSRQEYPLVLVLPHHSQGGMEIFIYMPHRNDRFTIATTILSNCQATIQEAIINTCDNHFDLDTYIILNEKHQADFEKAELSHIQESLTKALKAKELPRLFKRRLPRYLEHFKIKPLVFFDDDPESHYTRLDLITTDRPGLLAIISHLFSQHQIVLHHAKISTAGERVEDTFYLSSKDGKSLDAETMEALKLGLV